MFKVFIGICLLVLANSCAYKVAIKQGTLLSKETILKIKVGMSRAEVEYLIGPPNIVDPADENRVFYIYQESTQLQTYDKMNNLTAKVIPKKSLLLSFEKNILIKLKADKLNWQVKD